MEGRLIQDSRRRRLTGRLAGAGASTGLLLQEPGIPLRQHGHNPNPLYFAAGAGIAILIVLLTWGASRLGPRVRHGLAARAGSRRRLRAEASAEGRSRAMMSELCPHGWRAQLVLFSPDDELPPDAPVGLRAQVALDWAELEDERRGVAVVRRVWAASIAEALEAMVADRRADEMLERIEQSAVADGTLWPDL
jgi:hypothetical protein